MKRDLRLDELAELVGKAVPSLRRLARQGRLPGAYKIGRTWRMSRARADELRELRRPHPEDAR